MRIKTDSGAARFLAGKTIKRVTMRPFLTENTGEPRQKTTDPVIHFTDGSFITFVVVETEVGEYGIEVRYSRI